MPTKLKFIIKEITLVEKLILLPSKILQYKCYLSVILTIISKFIII